MEIEIVPVAPNMVTYGSKSRMLKLHHMNLLNEIQETTLMMNLYQQQQLQQQQQQLQQQQATAVDQGTVGTNDQMAMLLHQQQSSAPGMDSLYGNGVSMSQRGSLGMGSSQADQQMQMLRQQQMMHSAVASGGAGGGSNTAIQQELLKGQQEQAALEERLRKLKEDIARRQKEAEDLEKQATAPLRNQRAGSNPSTGDGGKKSKQRKANAKEEEHTAKRPKLEVDVNHGEDDDDDDDDDDGGDNN